jgi:hypothetical protein
MAAFPICESLSVVAAIMVLNFDCSDEERKIWASSLPAVSMKKGSRLPCVSFPSFDQYKAY